MVCALNCVLMSDSTCDFSAPQAKLEGVRIIPFHYEDAAGRLRGDDDLFTSLGAHEFYDLIRSGAQLFTSQPSQLEFEEAFTEVLDAGDEAVLFCISSGISGGYEGALMALSRVEQEHPEAAGRIHVVNTYLASTPMHLLVHEACRKRDEGLSAAQIADWAREARWSAQTLFMVDNLASLHRGGRVPKTVAVAGDKLNVKPLLTFSLTGELGIVGVARGRKKGLAKLVDYFRRGCAKDGGNLVVAIGDADAREDGNALAERIKEQFPGARTLRSTIGPTIGCHVGPGMVSCCFWGEDRRSA
jgi:DegV family protein with EDD domain